MTRSHSVRAALLVVLGAALVPSLACRARDAPAAESRSLRADHELLVAPVVDDHPWVIALVTEISITRPPGADARLEGRLGHEGLRHPDPIIEGETREALADALATYEKKFPRSPELVPVWESSPFGPGERVAWRLYFADRSRGFVLDDQARATLEQHDHGPSVHLHLGEAQTAALAELSAQIVGSRLALSLDGEALMLPIVMDPLTTGDIQVLTQTREDPKLTAPALLERLTR